MSDSTSVPVTTPAAISPSQAQAQASPPAVVSQATLAAYTPNDIHTAREWLIAANPDIIPELVSGSTIAELEASLPAAKAAHARAVAQVGAGAQAPAGSGNAGAAPAGGQQAPAADSTQPPAATAAQLTAPIVPSGAAPILPVDVSNLSAEDKLAVGVAQLFTRPAGQ